jgi:hypothetical protein
MGRRIQFFSFFSRGRQKLPPAPEPPAAAVVSAAAISATNGAQPAGAASSPSLVPVAIRSLTRYQHDPAFKNFQWKLRHPPRTAAARGRSRADDDARRQKPRNP